MGRTTWRRCLGLLGAVAGLHGGMAFSQLLPPPPPPPVAEGSLDTCVSRYGQSGCAARIYAELLCGAVGSSTPVAELQQQLDQQYVKAAIDFRGVTAAQVERAAVADYVPMLCPGKRQQIRELFAPLENGAPG